MIYCCKQCGFLFHRYGDVQGCPACEHLDIRPATEEEEKRFYQQLEGTPLRKERRYEKEAGKFAVGPGYGV